MERIASRPGRRISPSGMLIAAGALIMVVFWTWALFFASKDAINQIDDAAWGERAERICATATEEREALADYREIDIEQTAQLAERAAIVDRSTDILGRMLDDVVSVEPSDDKGREIVPLWEADYREYLQNRRQYTDDLRRGHNEPFREADVEGIPISERIEAFTIDNAMSSCAPPRDLGA